MSVIRKKDHGTLAEDKIEVRGVKTLAKRASVGYKT